MKQKGIRRRGTYAAALRAARWFVVLAIPLTVSGCSSLVKTNSSIVRVQAKRNTPRANRLTYAGIRALHADRPIVAEEKFREAIGADATYGPAHNNLGLLLYEQGDLYQAVNAFERAHEFLPHDPTVIYNLGLALESAGRSDEALDLYYTAVSMDRSNPHFLGNLCRLRVRLGEEDDLLRQQLEDLVLIETRPEWRRWADDQLSLAMNFALDRGPTTPDLESSFNRRAQAASKDLKSKIIELSPVDPVSGEIEFESLPQGDRPEDAGSQEDSGIEELPLEAPMIDRQSEHLVPIEAQPIDALSNDSLRTSIEQASESVDYFR